MAHWPKTVGGNLGALLLAVCIMLIVVQSVVALSGPFIWASLAAVALMSAAAFIWRHRTLSARDLALADAPSFADVLRRRHADDALEPHTP